MTVDVGSLPNYDEDFAMSNLDQLHDALQAQLNQLRTLWQRKDAAGIYQALYTPDTEITGAGTPELFTGEAALTQLVSELVSGSPDAKIDINHVRALGDDAAYTWVTWLVSQEQGEPFQMKSLFLWRKVDGAWRIVADFYAEGTIPA